MTLPVADTIAHSHPTSLSNPQEVSVTHLDWEFTVDFDLCILKGTAEYSFQRHDNKQSNPDNNNKKHCLALDTAHLKVHSVTDQEKNVLNYHLKSASKSHLGQQLIIELLDSTEKVSIAYETTRYCTALQWLPPKQTVGKKYPYLYTQCFAIHARSLVPCQDLPLVKFTFTAAATVPNWATCVMSALLTEKTANTNESTTFHWEQKIPLSSYLLALAVGQLAKQDISERCAVWCEPALLDAAATEFSQLEQFLTTAEHIAGADYVWGRYDVLCLPPSSPFGGVENPCLTFVTPTLLTGDKSLVDVIAHEIAHSWTGNLVTNASWDHFWLNEGWTMWLQRKIMARVQQNDAVFDFDAQCGTQSLQRAIQDMPAHFTKLVMDIQDADPDTAYSVVAYEKGFQLLVALERRVGKEAFEAFFQSYVAHFSKKTITSEEFKAYFKDHFRDHDSLADFAWDAWLYEPGLPPETIHFDNDMALGPQKLADIWLAVDRNGRMLPTTDLQSWTSGQKTYFLDLLYEVTTAKQQPLEHATLNALHKQYGFAETSNAEILFRYCLLAIASEGQGILPIAFRFITSQGRLKYVRPLYRALHSSRMGRQVTTEIFLANKDFYHPICAKLIVSDLKLDRWWKQRWFYMTIGGVGVAALLTATVMIGRTRRSKL